MSTQRFEQPGSRPYSPSPIAPGPGSHWPDGGGLGRSTASDGGTAAEARSARAPQAQQAASWPAPGGADQQAAPARARGRATGLAIAALVIVLIDVAMLLVSQLYGRLGVSPEQVRALAPVFVVIRVVMAIVASALAAFAVARSPQERRRLPGIALGASVALVAGALVSILSSFLMGAFS